MSMTYSRKTLVREGFLIYNICMANTVILSESAYKKLVNRLSHLERVVMDLVEKFGQEPPEGTDAWWERAHKMGMDAKKNGQYTRIKTKTELKNFFKNL